MRFAVIAGGVLAIVAGLGVGYAALSGSEPRVAARAPGAAATTAPSEDLLDLEPAEPVADPVTGAATDPVPAITTTPAAAATTTAGERETVPAQTPGATTRPAEPVATVAPPETEPTTITQPAVPELPLPLAATFTYEAVQGEDGWTGYTGTVRVSNPGERPSSGWTITLTVPGGNVVSASGATVSQDGETVTFTGEPIAEQDSVSFTFTVEGTLAELPGGCRIDGSSCA